MEIWKDIKNFEDYQVSNNGRIKSLKFGRETILKQLTNKKGYLYVMLYKNGKGKISKVHRLVAEAFIPNPENKPCINHKSGVKTENNIENLEWCTRKENNQHAFRTGLHNIEQVRQISKQRARQINQYDINENFINTWNSIKEASENLKIHEGSICECCKKKRRKTAGGYVWRYKEEVK